MNDLLPNAGQYTITRHLPKTGQTTSYGPDDDGDDVMTTGEVGERGWWRRRLNANNKTRFIIKTISSVDVVVDRATGLMWPRDCTGAGGNNGNPINDWFSAIIWIEALNFAGFTDWHMPNINEWLSILHYQNNPGWHSCFQNVINNYYWSSTTYILNTLFAMAIRFQFYVGGTFNKTAPGSNMYIFAVRETVL